MDRTERTKVEYHETFANHIGLTDIADCRVAISLNLLQ
jgi:hypothetical protein